VKPVIPYLEMRSLARTPGRLALTVVLAVSNAHLARAADAPWGFAWSQKRESLPQPSSVRPDANITGLIYQGPTIPPQMKDTEVVVLSICEHYGLQQVRWVSRLFGRSAAIDKFLNIYAEGAQRHGEADEGDLNRGTVGWSREGIGMRIDREEQGGYRVIMISDGPEFQQCRAEHRQISGEQ
jgi:hypothetical protein